VTDRRVLIVTPYFPPSTVAGVHRARLLAKHLPKWGWQPVVVCVHEKHHKEALDPGLAALVPNELKVVKVDAWPSSICRPLGLNDVGVRGYRAMKGAIEREIATIGADLLFITILPGFPMAMGPSLRQRYKIPFVLDYQDPWLPEGYREETIGTKKWLAYRIAQHIERQVIEHADMITSVSEGTNDLLRSRYRRLDSKPIRAIPIGGDAEDFNHLRNTKRLCPILERIPGQVTVSYVGTILPRGRRTLLAVLSALARVREIESNLYQRLRFLFVGSSNQPSNDVAKVVMPVAEELGLAERVVEEPGRAPYLDALNILLHSDIVLMMGSDEAHYTASKLYPGLLSGRPVLAIYHEGSSVCEIAERVGGVRLIKFGASRPVENCVGEIAQALVDLASNPSSVGAVDIKLMEPYLAPAIARQFAAAFEAALAQFQA
jgi:glycosyltransferase involved in cell wall biosynthesis